MKNRIRFKIKSGYYFKLLTPETKKLLGSTKSKITKDENGKNQPHLEITEVVLVHCNIGNNDHQQDSRVLYTFIRQLLDISPKTFIFKKAFNSEFPSSEIWFTGQNSKPLDLDDNINITLVLNQSAKYKK